MRKESNSSTMRSNVGTRSPAIGDCKSHSEVILKILSDAEPDGIRNDEFRRLASEKGICEKELNDILKPLMQYANIYFNAAKGKYHYMWSSSIQYE